MERTQIVRKPVQQSIMQAHMQVCNYAVQDITDCIMRNDRDNLIVEMTTDFALMIIGFAEKLERERKFVIARQVLRSGTSIGANVREAQNAESKADFIHKFKISAKEVDETRYWLILCMRSESYPDPDLELLAKLNDIHRIISKIISSSKA